MRAIVWIAEGTWEACVDQTVALLPEDAEITLLHVAPQDVEDSSPKRAPGWHVPRGSSPDAAGSSAKWWPRATVPTC